MANIPLKTIKFPGLDDTYTVPQIDSSFTGVAGEVPDSNKVKGEIDSLKEDLNTLNEGGLVIKDEVIAEEVQNWLDDHPEATTSVLDYSLTDKKLVKGTLGFITPEMFGAVGDGVNNDTTSMQNALDFAAANNLDVILKNVYLISSVTIPNGVKSITGGTIKGNGTVNTGIVVLGNGNEALKNCKISISIDMSAGESMGINGTFTENCIFEKCHIYGCTDDAVVKKYLIRVVGSIRNTFKNNLLEAVINPTGAYQYLLILASVDQSISHGGIFDDGGSTLKFSEDPALENKVIGNTFVGGTHNIVVNDGIRNIFSNNLCRYPSHRGIALQSACVYNLISNNEFHGFRSAGILMTYGCEHNEIIGNVFTDNLSISPAAIGEGAICGYLHVKYNKIIGNKINSARLYGIYLAVDAVGNVVENNVIESFYSAGVALECDWIPSGMTWADRSWPTDAKFSKQNISTDPFYDSDGNEVEYVGYVDCQYNVIQNNVFGLGSSGNYAQVYISQMGDRLKVINNTIKGNTFISTNASSQYYMYYFEEVEDKFISNYLLNNAIQGNQTNVNRFWMSQWRKHFSEQFGNSVLDDANVLVTGTSFSAYYGKVFRLNNSSATTLTAITDTINKQELLIRLDGNTTIQHNTSIRLKGNASITPQSNLQFVCLKNVDGILIEQYRNF